MASLPALLIAGLALLLAAQAQPPSSMRPTPDIIGDRPTARVSWTKLMNRSKLRNLGAQNLLAGASYLS
jgi:hypothetical protein